MITSKSLEEKLHVCKYREETMHEDLSSGGVFRGACPVFVYFWLEEKQYLDDTSIRTEFRCI